MNLTDARRQVLLGTGAIVGSIVFLAILAATQYVILQHPVRWDLTRSGKHTLAPQSKKAIQSFKEKGLPIEATAFYETKDFAAKEKVQDLLDQYRDVYSDFKYTFVDPDKERAIALQHKIDFYPTVVIKAAGKDERIANADEETITNTLVKLLRSEVKKVYFVKGHKELSIQESGSDGMSQAKDQIQKQNYKVEEIVLLQTESVPDDAAMVVLAGPDVDPMDSELSQIRSYLKRGGKLLVMLRPFRTPKLAAMLKDYGFETKEDIVVDRTSRVLGGDYLMPVITEYDLDFPITKNFKVVSFFPEARSVAAAKDAKPDIAAKDLARTSQGAWTISQEQLSSGNANFDEKTGVRGPISLMAVSTCTSLAESTASSADNEFDEEKAAGQGPNKDKAGKAVGTKSDPPAPSKAVKARLVVFGSAQFPNNKFFGLQGNGDLFMNTVSWLAEDENLISIRPKPNRSQPVILTGDQSLVIMALGVVLIPGAWIAAGLVVFLRRRRTAAG
jgi:ABC-type uncharacterized transport system involved in gliding motility auxiliary subunit